MKGDLECINYNIEARTSKWTFPSLLQTSTLPLSDFNGNKKYIRKTKEKGHILATLDTLRCVEGRSVLKRAEQSFRELSYMKSHGVKMMKAPNLLNSKKKVTSKAIMREFRNGAREHLLNPSELDTKEGSRRSVLSKCVVSMGDLSGLSMLNHLLLNIASFVRNSFHWQRRSGRVEHSFYVPREIGKSMVLPFFEASKMICDVATTEACSIFSSSDLKVLHSTLGDPQKMPNQLNPFLKVGFIKTDEMLAQHQLTVGMDDVDVVRNPFEVRAHLLREKIINELFFYESKKADGISKEVISDCIMQLSKPQVCQLIIDRRIEEKTYLGFNHLYELDLEQSDFVVKICRAHHEQTCVTVTYKVLKRACIFTIGAEGVELEVKY